MQTFDTEKDYVGDGTSCNRVRQDLKHCVLTSDCVVKDKRDPYECLRNSLKYLPTECHKLRIIMFECKRSLIDNRQRFRGRKGY